MLTITISLVNYKKNHFEHQRNPTESEVLKLDNFSPGTIGWTRPRGHHHCHGWIVYHKTHLAGHDQGATHIAMVGVCIPRHTWLDTTKGPPTLPWLDCVSQDTLGWTRRRGHPHCHGWIVYPKTHLAGHDEGATHIAMVGLCIPRHTWLDTTKGPPPLPWLECVSEDTLGWTRRRGHPHCHGWSVYPKTHLAGHDEGATHIAMVGVCIPRHTWLDTTKGPPTLPWLDCVSQDTLGWTRPRGHHHCHGWIVCPKTHLAGHDEGATHIAMVGLCIPRHNRLDTTKGPPTLPWLDCVSQDTLGWTRPRGHHHCHGWIVYPKTQSAGHDQGATHIAMVGVCVRRHCKLQSSTFPCIAASRGETLCNV